MTQRASEILDRSRSVESRNLSFEKSVKSSQLVDGGMKIGCVSEAVSHVLDHSRQLVLGF